MLHPKSRSKPTLSIGLLAILSLSAIGCHRDARATTVRYAFEETYGCAQVRVRHIREGRYRAVGCNSRAIYACSQVSCTMTSNGAKPRRISQRRDGSHLFRKPDNLDRHVHILASQGKLSDLKISLTKHRKEDALVVERQGPKRLFRKCKGAKVASAGTTGRTTVVMSATVRSTPVGGNQFSETFKISMTPAAIQTLAQGGGPILQMCDQQHVISEAFSAAVAESLKKTVSTTLDLKSLQIILQAEPADAGDEVWLGFSIRSPRRQYTQCDIAVLTNGEPMALPAFTYKKQGPHDRYQARIPLERVAEIVEHVRTVGRVCDLRFELKDQHREQAAKFLMQFKEERAFAQPSKAEPEPEPTAAPAGSTAL